MIIMEDAIRCKTCGSYIRTDTDYNMIECACGSVAVDGGPNYIRILGNQYDWEIVAIPVCKE